MDQNPTKDTVPRDYEHLRGLTASKRFQLMNALGAFKSQDDKTAFGDTKTDQAQVLLEALHDYDRNKGANGQMNQQPPMPGMPGMPQMPGAAPMGAPVGMPTMGAAPMQGAPMNPPGMPMGPPQGMPMQMPGAIPQGMPQMPGMPQQAPGVPQGPPGAPPGMPRMAPPGMPPGMPQGAPPGMPPQAGQMPQGMPQAQQPTPQQPQNGGDPQLKALIGQFNEISGKLVVAMDALSRSGGTTNELVAQVAANVQQQAQMTHLMLVIVFDMFNRLSGRAPFNAQNYQGDLEYWSQVMNQNQMLNMLSQMVPQQPGKPRG